MRDKRWLMVADREEIERRLYDDDEEADDDDKRYDDVANDEPGVLTDMSMAALLVAGGTLPEFGPDGALRPPRERGDDDVDDDGIPNDWDAVDNDDPDDDDEPGDIELRRARPRGPNPAPGRADAGRSGRRAGARSNPSSEFLYANKWRIFGVMMIGWAMSLLDVSIVNISIPELQDEMSTDVATVTWVINAYNITFAILLVSMGRLADQFGRKRFFVIGLTVFTIGSALCAAAWSVEWLIVFRVIQGVGAGILAPLGFAITVLVFPPEHRGRGLGADRGGGARLVGARPGDRRRAGRGRELALDLPDQHPVRDRRRVAVPALVAGDLGPDRGPRDRPARHAAARRRRVLPHGRSRRGQPLRRRPGALAQPDAGRDPARRGLRLVGAAGAPTR